MKTKNKTAGFTLMEALVSVAIFVILALSVYEICALIIKEVRIYRQRVAVSDLADQYIEIARNLPYSQIGTINGNPHGSLPDYPNASTVSVGGISYKIYYAVSYVDDPADGTALAGTDPAPDDYKQIKVYIQTLPNGETSSFLTNIAPKGLENLISGGALVIKVFDAFGQPVSDATIQITNTSISPQINLTRTSDASGNWIEVGLPNSANSYHVVVAKTGYSSDQSYPISGQNPNPTKPDATISNGQVTQVSFSIDKLSNLTFNTLNQVCAGISGVGLEIKGSKIIGTPNVLKFDNTYSSDGGGQVTLNNIEWDTYTPQLTGTNYMIYGTSPIQQVNILPNTNQTSNLLLGPSTQNSLLTIVKDASTGNPIEGASAVLTNGSNTTIAFTGGSIWSQQDWSSSSKYDQTDGGVDGTGVPSGLRLLKLGGVYVSSGWLTSLTFDTGTNQTSYTTLSWQPTSQDPSVSIKFQIATNNNNSTWNYLGPDGTVNTYYTVPGTTIGAANNSNRYVRYKVYLSTLDSAKTPVLTSVNVNYVSGCFAPGQAMFPGLSAGSGYQLSISANGYQTQNISNINIGGYNVLQILLSSN